MKILMPAFFTFIFYILGCSSNVNESNETESSSSAKSSSELQGSSSSSAINLLRVWDSESNFGKYSVEFSYLDFDTAWLSITDSINYSTILNPSRSWISQLGDGSFILPDSTFLRGDTIRYRIGYMLDGKVDSTEWQTYVFLGNHVTYTTLIKDDTIQQFDSIAYPIVLGPNDSCGQAIVAFIYTYSTADTFDYEANWNAMFSDGRTYVKNYNLACPKEAPPLFGKLGIMTYEGDINEAAKAIQKINPVFFLNLKPFCEEYTQCIIPNPL